MTARTPVEFVALLSDGTYQRVGNNIRMVDSNGVEIVADSISGGLKVIDVVHYEIHQGETFTAGYMSPHESDVADDGTIDVVIESGSKYLHMIARASFGGDFEAYLYEAPDIDADGTPITPQNHKRTGGEATTATIVHSPTVNATGTLLESLFLPGGTGGNSIGIIGSQREEWITNLNTKYLIRLINRAGSAKQGGLGVIWYEEDSN